jgi:capsular polysaccharide biosynthesis protein
MGQRDAADGHGVRSLRIPGVAVWRRRLSTEPRLWRWLVIPLCGSLGLAAGILWALAIPPTYTATALAFVALSPRPPDDQFAQDPYSGGKFALQRTPTYAALATSTDVLRAVAADVHRGDVEQLRSHIRVAAIPDRVILQLSVDDSDAKAATQIADSLVANLGRAVGSLERGGAGPLELGRAPAGSTPVQIVPVQPASLEPVSPRRYKALAGLLAGLVIGAATFYLMRFRRGAPARRSTSSRPGSSAGADADTDVLSQPTVRAEPRR